MISFKFNIKQLVQNKRCKMLVLVLFLVVSVLFRDSSAINLTYILKKGNSDKSIQPSCIAEENERYAGVAWVFPLPTTQQNLPEIVNKFIPTLSNKYNCNFDKNEKCRAAWANSDWKIAEDSRELLLDQRWESFPTFLTSKESKEFEHKIEVSKDLKLGFSVMASESVELLLCEGWNPYDYSCYHFNITLSEIFLRKYQKLPAEISQSKDRISDSYKAFSSILSAKEWRNFVVTLTDGTLQLKDVVVNRTVIEFKDNAVLTPLYLFMRSEKPAAWKIHQNNFMYTETEQFSRLGPLLKVNSKDLCVSLFVSMCRNCGMEFKTRIGSETKILKKVSPISGSSEWRLIKLKYENFPDNNITIFVQTKFLNATEKIQNATAGFWAYDDVRICHENEVKVTFLNVKENDSMIDEEFIEDISCQIVKQPKWRPKRVVYPEIIDFPTIQSTAQETSIHLKWTQEDPDKRINYFITYEANDICPSFPFNIKRLKSNGFLMTKQNEITIDHLVPYTKYNISFTSVLHEKEKKNFVTTLQAATVQPEEMPNNIQIQVTDTSAAVSWEKIDCQAIYGHILYAISLKNTKTNATRKLKAQTENIVEITHLEPFTLYTLDIRTIRSEQEANSSDSTENAFVMSANFKTKAGLAASVQNLEIYATDNDSVSMRYDLPKSSKGIPVYIQVIKCFPLLYKKCKSSMSKITACSVWPDKYCLDVNNIAPHQNHTFKVSIKNDDTSDFGEQAVVSAETIDRIPAPPTNISYRTVDCKVGTEYCHLNVTWLHPYNPNGTINSFHLYLNTSDNVIKEIYKIHNKSYQAQYEKQIKYVPYSTSFEVFIQSSNFEYKSEYASARLKTAEIGDYIDQTPKLTSKNDNSAIFQLVPLDIRLDSYSVTVLVQDFNKSQEVSQEIKKMSKVSDHLCHKYGKSWIEREKIIVDKNSNGSKNVLIGNENKLQAKTKYCVTFIITNEYKNSEHDVVYYKEFETDSKVEVEASNGSYNHLYVLLLLLLLIPIGFLLYRRYGKRRRPKNKSNNEENKENEYETLPFDECEFNCVNNDNYDHLLHK